MIYLNIISDYLACDHAKDQAMFLKDKSSSISPHRDLNVTGLLVDVSGAPACKLLIEDFIFPAQFLTDTPEKADILIQIEKSIQFRYCEVIRNARHGNPSDQKVRIGVDDNLFSD